jgi:hypothetical protein
MKRHWRVVLATFCVEAVAAVAVLVYGALSLVAVVIIYWIDLAFVIGRAVTRQLVRGETTVVQLPRALPQFRLLKYKRGTLSFSERLPPVYLRSLPTVLFSLSLLAASALSTAVVLSVSVSEQFWSDPITPLVLGGGVIAAATKSWLIYTAHIERSGGENTHEAGFIDRTRQMLVLLYASVAYVAADISTTALAEPEVENTVIFGVSVMILLRVAYAIHASRSSPNSTDSVSWIESIVSDKQPSATHTPPSTPDERPLKTVEPVSRSVPVAGFVNVLTTGGVVDGQFSDAGLHLRIYSIFVLVPGTLAAVTGSLLFQIVIAGVLVSVIVFWLLSAVHMELAFGTIEYRFYESTIVAYDSRLEEPQWSIPYDSIEAVSVEKGLFASPGWLDTGTVTVEITDDAAPMPDKQGRAPVLFVSDPENVSDWISDRCRDARRDW